MPTLAPGIRDRVTDISCGGTSCAGNKFYLACTASGSVYSWGDDNEFGKLGRGNNGGSGGGVCAPFKTPHVVDRLQSVKAVKVTTNCITEFPIPSFVRFCHVLFWEFPCPT